MRWTEETRHENKPCENKDKSEYVFWYKHHHHLQMILSSSEMLPKIVQNRVCCDFYEWPIIFMRVYATYDLLRYLYDIYNALQILK